MNYLRLTLLLLLLSVLGTAYMPVFSQKVERSVRLHGKVPTGAELRYDGIFSFLDRMKTLPLDADSEGNFDISIPLDKPTYFTLSRNPLYMTPGDDLEVHIDADPQKSTFKGKGQEANIYLSSRVYAKGGSYLESGRNSKGGFDQILHNIDSVRNVRVQHLNQLTKVSKEFKDLEDKRIKADYVNSLFYYPNYRNRETISNIQPTREEYVNEMTAYYQKIQPLVSPLLKEIAADDKYLDIEVVRLDLYRASDIPVFNLKMSDRFNAFSDASIQLEKLNREITPEIYEELKAFSEKITYADIKNVFSERVHSATRLMKGNKAPDFKVLDRAGNQKKLSDYKGKILYIDFWATWCMPCLAEAPYFKALSKQFADVEFISISIDDKSETWRKFLAKEQHEGNVTELFNIDQELRKKWNILGIPRFLLIDKDFNIISDAAPRPSEAEKLKQLLNSL